MADQLGINGLVRRSRLLPIAIAVALVAISCGGSTSGGQSGPIKIALFGYGAANTYTEEVYHAAADYAAAHGAAVTFFDGKFDFPTQEHQMIDATTSGQYQGYLLLPNDIAGMVTPVKSAISHNIKVVTLHFQIGGQFTEDTQVPGLLACICASFSAGATQIANMVVTQCANKNPCNVINFYGIKTFSWETPRRAAYNAVIGQHSNIKLLVEPDDNFDQGQAYKTMKDLLQGHPHIDVVSSPSADQETLGAETALREAGYAIGGSNGVALIGNSSTYQGVAKVRSGDWVATYVHCPQTCEANIGVQDVLDSLGGKTVAPVTLEDGPQGPWAHCYDPAFPGLVDSVFLTNCPQYTGEYQG